MNITEIKEKITDMRKSLNNYTDCEEKVNINLTLATMSESLRKLESRCKQMDNNLNEINFRIKRQLLQR